MRSGISGVRASCTKFGGALCTARLVTFRVLLVRRSGIVPADEARVEVVSAAGAVTSEEFGPGVVMAGAVESDVMGWDEGVELLKVVSLFVSAIEARGRDSA